MVGVEPALPLLEGPCFDFHMIGVEPVCLFLRDHVFLSQLCRAVALVLGD